MNCAFVTNLAKHEYVRIRKYVGEQLILLLKITDRVNIAGYQATVQFDSTTLKYVESKDSDYLPEGVFPIPTIEIENAVTLATITFEVVSIKTPTVSLSDVLLTNDASLVLHRR